MGGPSSPDALALTTTAAAKFIGISRATFYALEKQGVFKGLESPIPGRWSRAKLEAWLAGIGGEVRGRRAVA